MGTRNYVNSAPRARTTGVLTPTSVSVTVDSLVGYPTAPYFGTLGLGGGTAEVLLVTAATGSTLTVLRGQDGSTAISHPSGETFDFTYVAQDAREANQHVNATTAVHGVAGHFVGDTDTQTLSNKTFVKPLATGGDLATAALTAQATVTGGKALSGRNPANVETFAVSDAGAVSAASVAVTGAISAATAAVPVLNGVTQPQVPVGSVTMFGAAAAPTGWLLCNGAAVSRATYAGLFAVVGTAYGVGDGSTTFNVPNMAAKFPVQGAPGAAGGAATHTHPLSDSGYADIVIAASDPSIVQRRVTASTWSITHQVTTAPASVGGGTQTSGAALGGVTDAGSTLPPFLSFAFIIKS